MDTKSVQVEPGLSHECARSRTHDLVLWWLWDGRKILRAPIGLKLGNMDFYGNTVAWVTASGHLAVMEFDQVGIERFEKWQYGRLRPRGDGGRD
ncbi:hypothetical protein TWF106_007150 [Orbilia oligospora]|uniref:Uncharacterized protein n=1 Tax=Orbilia oligospora TaxID=2813651 RepID=A0A7C8US34_ORBOL|nr:hypothetical protein TWF106_007150 [Orbilia oligospora]